MNPHPAAQGGNTAHGHSEDAVWMRHAIQLALRARGDTHPNPLVGAVIVKDGELLAEGWHARDGGPHAEIVALNDLCARAGQSHPRTEACRAARTAGQSATQTNAAPEPQANPQTATGATLYVTLEPCSTHGRTGACTEAIIRAGIARVVIGAIDPCPAHAGKAIPVLQQAGVEVSCGVLAEVCADLNLIFNHRIVSNQPFIAAKVAVTLDGKIATRTHDSRWITGEAARADVMLWRRYFPAIGVGAGTVLADNPSLTARTLHQSSNTSEHTPQQAGNFATSTPQQAGDVITHTPQQTGTDNGENVWCPRRLIFDRSGKTADRPDAHVFTDAFAHRTLVLTSEGEAAQRLEPLRRAGISVIALPAQAFEPEYFGEVLRKLLISEKLCGLYVEGGGSLLGNLLAARALDYLFSYRAPKLLADSHAVSPFDGQAVSRMADAFTLRSVCHATFGDDQLMRGHIVYPPL